MRCLRVRLFVCVFLFSGVQYCVAVCGGVCWCAWEVVQPRNNSQWDWQHCNAELRRQRERIGEERTNYDGSLADSHHCAQSAKTGAATATNSERDFFTQDLLYMFHVAWHFKTSVFISVLCGGVEFSELTWTSVRLKSQISSQKTCDSIFQVKDYDILHFCYR